MPAEDQKDLVGFVTDFDTVFKMVQAAYIGEPCRICGGKITEEEMGDAVYAGHSADTHTRIAHKTCWDKQIPLVAWVHQ